MGVFNNKILAKFVNQIDSECSRDFEPAEICECLLLDMSDIYQIGKATFEFIEPASPLRPDGIHIEKVVIDRNNGRFGDMYQYYTQTGDRGSFKIVTYSMENVHWTDIEKEEIEYILTYFYKMSSRYVITKLLRKSLAMDMMTGVYNQAGFLAYIEKQMATKQAYKYYTVFLNVRNFGFVNKVFSHQQGDEILRKYAQAVNALVEGDEIVGRVGGDNFVVYVHKDNIDRFLDAVDKIVIEHDFEGVYRKFEFPSIKGIASMEGLNNSHDIMNKCGMAYQFARKTKSGKAYFARDLYEKVMKQQEYVINFTEAIENEEFVVYYQPKIDVDNNSLVGAEALVRWQRDSQLIMPMEFIPSLEQNGSIRILDYYVLKKVCEQLDRWKKNGMQIIRISVNFSRKHFEEEGFVEKIINIVSSYNIEPNYIEIELTESDSYQDYDVMSKAVNQLKAYGIHVSIDDFGALYSSFNLIKNTGFDIVKIDKSFIPKESQYENREKEFTLFRNIMNLISELNMESIVEGVESVEQLEFVKASNCKLVQGYLFDKPMPCEEFEKRLVDRKYTIPDEGM